MASRYPEVARAYIEYRHDRDLAREKRSQLTKEIERFDWTKQRRIT